jgi:hypothetical protein
MLARGSKPNVQQNPETGIYGGKTLEDDSETVPLITSI